MPDALTYEQLLALVGELSTRVAEQDRLIAEQADQCQIRSRSCSGGWVMSNAYASRPE